MKTSLLKRSALGAAALGSLAAGVVTLAPQAQAVVTPPGVVITAAGSDTTDDLMNVILQGQVGNTYLRNIRAVPPLASAGGQAIEGDASCADLSYAPTASAGFIAAPNGSGAGITAVQNAPTNPNGPGCIDIARSSSGPTAVQTPANSVLEYYAYAMDSVTWASPSAFAPATLTKQDVKDIYSCAKTNWNQFPGGGTGPIQRYLPQSASGTYKFFLSDILDSVVPVTGQGASCPDPIQTGIQENDGRAISNANFQKAIIPYSAGQWLFQATGVGNPTIDKRKEVRLGGFTTAATNAAPLKWNAGGYWQVNKGTLASTPVNEANVSLNNPSPDYPGVRYLYNVLNNTTVNYTQARDVVGFAFAGGTVSPFCSNNNVGEITSAGFAALDTTNTYATNPGGTNCRMLKHKP